MILDATALRAEPTPAPNRAPTDRGDQDGTGAPPVVSCKDGTHATPGRYPCRRHGGVADAAPNARSSPAIDTPPLQGAGEAAGILCRDGTRSATSGSGGCAEHGGGATVTRPAPVP
jgi:hypothetical protein